MAAVRSRRPVVMSTPPAQQKSRSGYTAQAKQGLLDNFDLEVADRTRVFTTALETTLTVFMARQDLEIMKIPHELRSMTLGELELKWGGTWAGTVQRIARLKIEEREREEREEREREEKERREREEGMRKRKRGTNGTTSDSPGRSTKNACKAASSRTALGSSSAPASARKGRAAAAKRGKASAAAGSSKPPSTLPQDHVFNPSIPSTPLLPRAPRANESFVSLNGSPLAFAPVSEPESPLGSVASASRLNTPSTLSRSKMTRNLADRAEGSKRHSSSNRDGPYALSDTEEDEDDEDDLDDSFELPDAAAYEAKLLAQQTQEDPHHTSTTQSSKTMRKPKRAPSLLFRQSIGGVGSRPSLAGGVSTPAKPVSRSQFASATDENLVDIELSDGRTISFNPMAVSPGRIQSELDEGGVSKAEQERVQARIKEEAMAALLNSMKKWQVA